MAKTDWNVNDTVRPEDMNQIGREINEKETPAGAQQKVDNIIRIIPFKPASDRGETYQNGITMFQLQLADDSVGYPSNLGTVVTYHVHNNRVTQWFYKTNTNSEKGAYFRHYQIINGWTAWQEVATTESVQDVQSNLNEHLADNTSHVHYAVATGSANNYVVTLNPAPSSYVEGLAVAIKISIENTGTSTININGLGAKPIKKSNGNDVASGNLKAGSVYTLRYNGTNFILQGEGGGYYDYDFVPYASPATNLINQKGLDDAIINLISDDQGNVYAISANGHVIKLNPNLEEIWRHSEYRTLGRSLALDSSGNLYCAYDPSAYGGGTTLLKLDTNGSEVWTINGNDPSSNVAINSQGYVYCTYRSAHFGIVLRVFNSDGEMLWEKRGLDFTSDPQAIAIDSSNNIYTGHSGTTTTSKGIRKSDPSANPIWQAVSENEVWDLVIDEEENVLFTQGRLYTSIIAKSLTKLNGGTGEEIWSLFGTTARSVAIAPSGDIYVSHERLPSVLFQKVTGTGQKLLDVDFPGSRGRCPLTVDQNGHLYVSYNRVIQKYTGNQDCWQIRPTRPST